MTTKQNQQVTEIVKYTAPTGVVLDARVDGGQVWLTYEQASTLFGIDISVTGKHIRDIITEGELANSTTARFALVRTEGNRSVNRDIVHINQDMVMHIGYRVRSDRGVEFRRWATDVLLGRTSTPTQMQPPTIDPMAALAFAHTTAIQHIATEQAKLRLEIKSEISSMRGDVADQSARVDELASKIETMTDNQDHEFEDLDLSRAIICSRVREHVIREATERKTTAFGLSALHRHAWRRLYKAFAIAINQPLTRDAVGRPSELPRWIQRQPNAKQLMRTLMGLCDVVFPASR